MSILIKNSSWLNYGGKPCHIIQDLSENDLCCGDTQSSYKFGCSTPPLRWFLFRNWINDFLFMGRMMIWIQ